MTWIVVVLGVAAAIGCSDDTDDPGRAPETATDPQGPRDPTTTTVPSSALAPLLLTEDDLPERFEQSDTVDDTLTTVCADQDATAGLRATDRAVVGYRSEPPGLAVVQIVLELGEDGAATFVAQATELLDGCSSVPDLSGLAFDYSAATAEVDAMLAEGTDAHVARRGVSVGSGSFVLDLAFFHRGGTGQLVAVIGLDEAPGDLLDEVLAVVLDRP